MTYADTCTRVHGPNGSVAHLSPSVIVLAPLCAARAKPPAGGWRDARDYPRDLPACKHCERIAAARDLAAPETPAGGEPSAGCADGTNSPLAGSSLPVAAPQPQPGLAGDSFLKRWRAALSGQKASQRGDRGRRARAGRGQDSGPGMHRHGGTG